MVMQKYLKSCLRMVGAGCLAVALTNSPAMGAEKLKVTLNWTPGNSDIGIQYADALGYYKEAGIDLEIEPGKGSGTTSQLVAAGSTDVGLANAASAISIAAKGAPIKIIAPIYQSPAWGIISLEDTPISRPKDLEGKTIAIPPGAADIPLFETMVKVNGVDRSKINVLSADAAAFIGLLAEKKVDAVSAAAGDVMIPLETKGVKTKAMWYKDYGAPIVGLSLIAREDKLKKNPDLYKRFVDATLRGMSAVIKNPEAAVDALRSRNPDAQPKSDLMEELTKYEIVNICGPGASGLGKPSADVWKVTGEVLTQTLGSLGDGGIETKYTEDYLPAQLPPCP
ncbi:ABC transporter substrate-binding protein [Mesorhizobium sangaii]|uniref:Thiamine pyrimidine synthase n=1 Tax=Mesorhizobium sangaii TaxID=505389 RepID=A0A841PYD3_9HYPH|nr:ABC transporter substrate-binding protein [Mesorhizobium sangaii]MBB6413765.1 NitT/TauT family transport system substrate-binding protein [Mesorhizobium sangaii]